MQMENRTKIIAMKAFLFLCNLISASVFATTNKIFANYIWIVDALERSTSGLYEDDPESNDIDNLMQVSELASHDEALGVAKFCEFEKYEIGKIFKQVQRIFIFNANQILTLFF